MVCPPPLFPPPLAHPADVDLFCGWLDELGCDVEPVHDQVSAMLCHYPRDDYERGILTARFGLDGRGRATLQEIGDEHAITRERVRQLVDRSVMRLAGRLLKSGEGEDVRDTLTERYGPARDVEPLVRRLTLEACATGTGPLTKSFAVMKLRVAGHRVSDTEQLANEVRSGAARVRKQLRRLERKAAVADSHATAHLQRWLDQVQWPADTAIPPHPITGRAIRSVDVNEEGHGATFLDKLGRDVAWESRFEARLLRILNASHMVATFQEQPVCIHYQRDGCTRRYYPDVVAQLRDGRTVLIEVKPIFEVAYAVNQDKFEAGRIYAHSRGWGWLVWTDRDSIPELMRREVDRGLAQRITAAVMAGGVDWTAVRSFNAQGFQFLDLIALTIANRWRWERGPFRLTVGNRDDG